MMRIMILRRAINIVTVPAIRKAITMIVITMLRQMVAAMKATKAAMENRKVIVAATSRMTANRKKVKMRIMRTANHVMLVK